MHTDRHTAPDLTLAATRRPRRVEPAVFRLSERYPDDPVGDYEPTDGGW